MRTRLPGIFVIIFIITFISSSCDNEQISPSSQPTTPSITVSTSTTPIIKWYSEILPPSAMASLKYSAIKVINDRSYLIFSYAIFGEGVGIGILDVSDPDKPIEISYLGSSKSTEEYNGVTGLQLKGSVLYAATYNYLWVIDVSDIYNPREIGRISSLASYAIEITGQYLCMIPMNAYDTVTALDISDAASPKAAGSIILRNEVFKLASSGSLLCALSARGLYVIDTSSADNLIETGFLANPSPPHTGPISPGGFIPPDFLNMEIVDYIVYIISGINDLHIVDVSNPSNPKIMTSFRTIDQGTHIIVSGKLAYLLTSNGAITFTTGVSHKVAVVDISNKKEPEELKGITLEAMLPPPEDERLGKSFAGMIEINGYLYLASETQPAIEIINLANFLFDE